MVLESNCAMPYRVRAHKKLMEGLDRETEVFRDSVVCKHVSMDIINVEEL